MMSLRQLECLVRVVDEGSFTRAAELMHVTQSALSHQLRALERDVGGPLLERLPRSVRPTPTGRALLPHARAALASAERALCAARHVNGLEIGELQVATVYSISLGVLPAVLRSWHRTCGNVHIRLFEHRHANELRSAMVAGQADLAVGPVPSGWNGTIQLLGHEEFVVVVSTDDLAAADGATQVDISTLAERNWVHYAAVNGLAGLLDQVCAIAGFEPKVAVRTEQTAVAPLLASAGLGPALVPANIIPPHFDGRLLRPNPPILRELAAYARGPLEPLAATFVETLMSKACLTPAHVHRQLNLDADPDVMLATVFTDSRHQNVLTRKIHNAADTTT